jgi:hypothetical protein
VLNALQDKWTLEEVKAQVKKMKLKTLDVVKQPKTPEASTINKLRTLIPNGKLPNKGTIRREFVEDEIMHRLFIRRDDSETDTTPSKSIEDVDDQVWILELII